MVTLENRQRTCLHIVDYQTVTDDKGETSVVENGRIVLGDADDRDRIPEPGRLRKPGDERNAGIPGPVVQLTDKEWNALQPATQQLIASYVQRRTLSMIRGRAS